MSYHILTAGTMAYLCNVPAVTYTGTITFYWYNVPLVTGIGVDMFISRFTNLLNEK